MGPSILFSKALVLALGFGTHVAVAACTRSIKAVQGDTCASLAAVAGITVAQFLRSNPSVTSCTTLSPGLTYCLEGVAESAPSTSAPAPTSGPLTVSTDGTCGPGVTCKGSRFGDCCSEHGFCGNTGSYCGEGCQAGLGVCGSNPEPSQSPTITSPPVQGTATVTKTVTATATTTSTNIVTSTNVVTITRASIVLQTQTSYIIVTSTAVATRTVVQSAIATATVTATATATQTVRATVLTTSTVLLTSTSTAFRTVQTTITKTNQVDSTSVVIETLTTIKTVSVTVGNTVDCGGGRPTIVNPPGPITLTPTTIRPTNPVLTFAPRPTPYLPGSSSSCKSYDQIQAGDSCREIATRNSVSLLDFYKLNPSVSANRNLLGSLLCGPDLLELLLSGLCQIDCDNLWTGYFVCVGT